MIRLVIAGIIVYVIYRFSKFLFAQVGEISKNRPGGQPRSIVGEDLVQDPYCGTYVPITSAHKATVDGKTMYFCSRECLEKIQ